MSGCILNRPAANTAPTAFTSPPTLPHIIETVNAHSARVQQIHASDVRLTMRGQMSLKATLDFERERRFRLSAGTRLTGAELDLGSNDSEFWMWVRRMQPPTVFHGRHDQFFESAAQQILPMPPHWIVEALGIVQLDPHGENKLYGSHTPGQLQLHTRKPTPHGTLLQIIEIDATRGWIVQQRIYGPDDRQLAQADASDFQFDPLQGVSLPRRVRVDLPPIGASFRLEVPSYIVNQPPTDPLSLWAMPRLDEYGVSYRDVANPADMQGIPLGQSPLSSGQGQLDPYDTRSAAKTQPTPVRAAWWRLPSRLSIFR